MGREEGESLSTSAHTKPCLCKELQPSGHKGLNPILLKVNRLSHYRALRLQVFTFPGSTYYPSL